jgi:hypothetical protein
MAFVHARPDPHADERAALMGWFDLQRGIIATKCTGLPDELAHRALIPTSPLMTVAGIVAHLTWAERLWFEHSLLDIPGPAPASTTSRTPSSWQLSTATGRGARGL